MGHSIKTLVLGSLVLLPALATAEPQRAPAGALDLVTRPGGAILARQIVQPTPSGTGGTQALAASLYIYLNKDGGTLTQGGVNNSANNVSTIVGGTRSFPAWNVDATTWNTVKGAVQEMFSPFNVTVSDVRPPAGTRFIMAMFGGTAGDALPPEQVPPPDQGVILGVSPFTPGCDIIEDSIVFTFTTSAQQLGESPRQIAEIAAQEIAHSFGLDHVLNASDPMTYLPYSGNRSFKSGAVSCGESTARQCGLVNLGYPACRPNQDDVGLLAQRVGTGGNPGDTVPPTLAITAPANNALVPPGFDIYVNATDNTAVTAVDVYIDDVPADSATAAPWQFQAPATISLGDHLVRVVASDGVQSSEQTITVTVDANADPVDPPGGGGGGDDDGAVSGGCSTGGGGQAGVGLILGLALAGFARRRRRR